jgi:DNA polymerase epsilon subunit 1
MMDQDGKVIPKVVKQRKRKSKSSHEDRLDVVSDTELPDVMPDMNEDYSEWLQFQKLKWKKQRAARIKRQEMGEEESALARNDNTAGGFFRRQAGSLVSSDWHILQIAETEVLGEYRMWIVTQRNLVCVKLTVPRIFYVNSHDDTPTENLMSNSAFSIEPRVRTLPRSHQCLNLFEMTMPEPVFQAEQKKFASFFNHPSTEGVYETQIPLLTRAILKLGCICKVDRKGSGRLKKLDDRFSLLDFVQDDLMSKDYLTQPKIFHYLYLYHAHADSRHMFALVGTALPQSRCFIVGTSKEHAQMPNLNLLYKQRYTEHQSRVEAQANETISYSEEVDFETTYHGSEKDALNAIQKELVKYQSLKRGPTIIAVASPRSTAQLVQQVRIMNEFPCVSMQSYIEDKRLPSIDWLRPTATRMINQYLNLGSWLTEKLLQARYASIPFCNIENDPYLYLADIAFARRLMKNDMVLWWSPSFKPDLGGHEEDENLYAVDELVNPEINHPGSYSNVCFELDVLRLCLNTLMEAPIINELEGSNGGIGFDNVSHTLDEYNAGKVSSMVSFGDGSLSAKTFSMLRGMVQTWFHEALEHNNRFAEMMIDTLHRWLTSPSSSMYDPCLYGLVHGMMKKVFMQLVAEFKRLGSQIVFANFNKIIVVTPKESMESGLPYCNYLLKAVQTKQVFEVLDIVVSNYWDQLLWMDEMNYGGILREKDNVANDGAESHAVVTMQWNIQDYLPVGTQDIFQRIIASYVYTTYNHRVKRVKETGNDRHVHRVREQDGDLQMNDDDAHNVELEFTRQYVRQDLTRRLLKQLTDVLKDQVNMSVDQGIQARLSFPKFAGSHLHLDNAALELVKSVCAVLVLDKSIESEVRVLKRNALNLIGSVPEFSDKAQFKNPCEYFKLGQVICSYCNYTSDLDFCRDRDLLPENGKVKPWKCKGCGTEYDKSFIEETLIGEVQRRLMAFQLQDLQCSKCHRVKQENLLKNCSACGGNFVQTQRKSDLVGKLTVFHNIAQEQKLSLLVEIVEWALSNC